MKIKFFIFLLLIGQITFGQSGNHKTIPGTKFSMIPPDGFVASTDINGFQNKQLNASITIMEMPVSVQEFSQSFTADELRTKGMTLVDKSIINLDSSKATYIKISQSANGTIYLKQLLISGDASRTTLVIGVYPEKNETLETDIRNALLSTRYDESQNVDPLETVSFKIDVSGSEFKFASYSTGGLIYTTDGVYPSEKPSLLIGNSIVKVPVEDKKQFCIDRLSKLPGKKSREIKEINPITINNLSGYEIVSNGRKDLKEVLLYQTIIFTDKGDFYFIAGFASENSDTYLKIFKNISQTFKRSN